jgi:hypothetical protein
MLPDYYCTAIPYATQIFPSLRARDFDIFRSAPPELTGIMWGTGGLGDYGTGGLRDLGGWVLGGRGLLSQLRT